MNDDKKKILVIILSVLIILGMIAVCVLVYPPDIDDGSSLHVIDEVDYSHEEIQRQLNEEVADSMINIQYSLYATFNDHKSNDFFVRNIKTNHHPITFKLYDENNELIYESDKIDLGYEFKGLSLDKELAKGEHEGTIQIGYASSGNVSSAFPIYLTVY